MKNEILAFLIAFFLALVCGVIAIPLLKKIKAGQTILKYVEEHKQKQGTPTMGGLFFVIPSCVVYIILGGFESRITLLAVAIGLAFMLVGFLDDFLKIKLKQNEGLKAYQKIIFQGAISIFAGYFCYSNEMTIFFIPFTKKYVDFGVLSIIFIAFIFVAITNSVNLTDGLDGLAGSVSFVYLIIIVALISVQYSTLNEVYVRTDEHESLTLLSSSLIGGILAFLCFNTFKAKVFMGDTGSLSLGAFLGAISIFSGNALFIPLVGIMFVLSSISVIIQVLYYKKTKKRVFLKAPLHHHFQLKGYSESKISVVYSVITLVVGMALVCFYL